jgi:hypothetical protein
MLSDWLTNCGCGKNLVVMICVCLSKGEMHGLITKRGGKANNNNNILRVHSHSSPLWRVTFFIAAPRNLCSPCVACHKSQEDITCLTSKELLTTLLFSHGACTAYRKEKGENLHKFDLLSLVLETIKKSNITHLIYQYLKKFMLV